MFCFMIARWFSFITTQVSRNLPGRRTDQFILVSAQKITCGSTDTINSPKGTGINFLAAQFKLFFSFGFGFSMRLFSL